MNARRDLIFNSRNRTPAVDLEIGRYFKNLFLVSPYAGSLIPLRPAAVQHIANARKGENT